MRRTHLWTALLGAVVIVPAANAGFAPFSVNGIFLDGQFTPARGIGVFVDGDIYQIPVGSNYPPSPGDIMNMPDLEFDSYVAFGGQPATASTPGIAPPETPSGFDDATGFFEQPGTIGGALFGGGPSNTSEINPFTGNQGFFFGRVTVPEGLPIGGGVSFDVVGEPGIVSEPIEIVDPEIPGSVGVRGFREFRVIAQRTEQSKELQLFTDARGDEPQTGFFDVYDLYIELVPAPGAAVTLVGFGAIATQRRRR